MNYSPVANFSTICVMSSGHFNGKSDLPMILIASLSCFCMASGEFNINVTINCLIAILSLG